MTEPTDDELETLARKHGATSYRNRTDTQHPAYGFTENGLRNLLADAVAKWGTPPAVAGEPFCYVSVNKQGDITRTMKRKDKWTNIPLYTTPQPTQAQAGAVPLTSAQIEAAAPEYSVDDFLDFNAGVRFAEQHHGIGIKGGQHGADT